MTALLALVLGGCAGLDSEQHLAPLYTHVSTAGGGEDHEALAGSVVVRRSRIDGPVDEWGVRPLFLHYRERDERSLTQFLYPFGRIVRGQGEVKWWLLPLADYRREDTVEGRRWSFLSLPGIYVGRLPDGRRAQAWFPIGGHVEELLSYDKLDFVLWPIWTRSERRGTVTHHVLWPLFSWTTAPDGGGWRAFPLAGHTWAEDRYDRWFGLWPVVNVSDENLRASPEQHEHRWTVFPLYGEVERGSYRSRSFLWPFFGYAEDPETGFWAWDGPWPLVRIMRPGDEDRSPFSPGKGGVSRTRFWPFWSNYRGDGLDSTYYLWPLFNVRDEDYLEEQRRAVTLVPLWSSFATVKRDGEVAGYQKLWPLYQYDREGETRRLLFPALNPLWRWPDLDEHYSWLYEIYNSERTPETVRTRSFLGLYRREKDPDEDRLSVAGLYARRKYSLEGEVVREHSLLFGLLRWRTRDSDGLTLMRPALPGPGWPIERVPSSLGAASPAEDR